VKNSGCRALIEALLHPLRRKLLKRAIERGEIAPAEAAREMDQHLSNVSYHVTQLAESGIVILKDTAQVRGAVVHFYTPDPMVMELPWVREIIGLGD